MGVVTISMTNLQNMSSVSYNDTVRTKKICKANCAFAYKTVNSVTADKQQQKQFRADTIPSHAGFAHHQLHSVQP